MKRRTDKKRSPAEIKADNSRHYGEMAGRVPSKKVEEVLKKLSSIGAKQVTGTSLPE